MRFVRLVHRHMVKMVQRVVELIGGGSVYNMQPETGRTSLVIEHRTLLLPVNDLLLQKELHAQIGHQRKAQESAVSDEEDLTYSGGCDGECVKIYEMRERTREMERWRRRQNERDGEVKDQKNTFDILDDRHTREMLNSFFPQIIIYDISCPNAGDS